MLLIEVSAFTLFLAVTFADMKLNTTVNTAQERQGDDCNCESIGPWKPVFKPSQIVHSDLPEHHAAHIFDIYSPRSDLKIVPHILVPVVNPVAYALHHDFGSQEEPDLKYSLLDSSITESTDSNGKPVIKWEHYGDVKQLSFKYKGSSKSNKNRNRLYNHKLEDNKPLTDSQEDKSKETQPKNEEKYNYSGEDPQLTENENYTPCSENYEDEKYFNSGSFFDGDINSQEQMELSKDFSDMKDLSQEDNFNTLDHSKENNPEFTKQKISPKKPATSYAFISSLISGIKTRHYNDINVQSVPRVKSPYSNTFTSINGHGHSHFVLHDKPEWLKQLNTKFNEGVKPKKYLTKLKPYNVHEQQGDEIRSYGYPRYSNQDNNYYPLNKEYLLGDFWESARKMEKMRPPPPAQTPTWFMEDKHKKPRTIHFNRDKLINSKKPFSYVYIIKTNKESNPLFIHH